MSMNVRWGVKTGIYKEGGWDPLWQRDSHKLERLYANNDVTQPVCIQNTHKMASIATREVTENYNEDAPVRTLVRGTWFWRYGTAPNSKLVALHEETAALAETWYQGIKEDIIRECCLASELSNDGGYVEPTGIGGFSTGPTTGIANSSSNGSRTISRPDLTKPWVLPVGEIMGPGAGQYRVSSSTRGPRGPEGPEGQRATVEEKYWCIIIIATTTRCIV